MSVVEFFQSERPSGRSVPRVASATEVQRSHSPDSDAAAALQNVTSADDELQLPTSEVGRLIVLALRAANLSPSMAAKRMGISLSLLLRQLHNVDNQHVSAQRLYRLSDRFWQEFTILLMERRRLGRVRREVTFEFEAAR